MKKVSALLSVLIVAGLLLSACATPTPEVIEKVVTQVVKQVVTEVVKETVKETVIVEGTPQVVEKEITKVVEVEKVVTATPEPERVPAVGGKMVWAAFGDPDTLDPQAGTGGLTLAELIGGTMLAIDPETSEFVPYLAKSVEILEDGLLWEIVLRDDIKFHDGTPLMADDYAWTLQRIRTIPSPATGPMTTGMLTAEAVDDYTVHITFFAPNYAMLYGMTTAFLQPLPRHYIERVGNEEFGRNPIGAGPYKFVEWQTGEKIVLERNPDFDWGPAYSRGGPPLIETIEYRFIPEYATRFAGLEAGEVDITGLEHKDVARIQNYDQFQVLAYRGQGIGPYILMNISRPPFDDLLVRKAFNYAVDRETLIQVILLGYGDPLYGPVTPSTLGYWPGAEYIGYEYDPEQARALLAEAGYTTGSDGILEKDGQALKLGMTVPPSYSRDAAVLQEQFKKIGVELELKQLEPAAWAADIQAADYDTSLSGWGWAEASILYALFSSSTRGFMNESHVNDPLLDSLLVDFMTATNREEWQKGLDEAQKYLVEQAYVVPLYNAISHYAITNRIKGIAITEGGDLDLFNAYIETE